jgi:hypothetical protein
MTGSIIRKSFLTILITAWLGLISTSLVADNIDNFKVVRGSSNQISIRFELGDWNLETQSKDGIAYKSIVCDAKNSLYLGADATVPVYSTMIAIPDGMDAVLEPQGESRELVESVNLLNREIISRENTNVYPSQQYVISNPGQFRDFRVVNINVYPFQLEKQTNNLKVTKSVSLILKLVPSTDGVMNSKAGMYSKSFDNLYHALVLNYDSVRDEATPIDKPVLLIIYPNTTDATFLTSFQKLVEWKKQKGYSVYTASTAAAQAGQSTTTIKNYILNAYNNWSERPDIVLLLGDASGTFSVPSYSESMSGWTSYTAEGDYPYSLLAGADLYGDVQLGRISISSGGDLVKYVAKIMVMEKDINVATATWLNKMLLVGDSGNSGISTIYTNQYIHEISKVVNPNYTYTELYGSPTVAAMNTAINTGVGFFNYRGWLGMSGWNPGNNQINGAKLNHGVFITCGTGSFISGLSTTEAYLRLGTEAVPAGGITAIGMASTGTHTAFNNTLCMAIFDGIFNRNMRTMGEALLFSKCNLQNVYGISNYDTANFFDRICNLIGDPTVEVFVAIPKTFNPTCPATIIPGTAAIEIIVKDASNNPVPDATVNIWQMNNCNQTAFTNEQGLVLLNLPATLVDSVLVTVSKHDYKPFTKYMRISGGGLIYQSSVIDDDSSGGSSGNNNQIINAGETIEFYLTLKNASATLISSITGTISCSDPNIRFLSTSLNFQDALAGLTTTLSPAVRFFVLNACPDNHPVTFYFSGTSSAGNWTACYQYTVKSPDLDYVSYSISGANSYLEPGETTSISCSIVNNGSESISSVYAVLRSLDSNVQVTDSLKYFGNIAAGATFSGSSVPFGISARNVAISGMTIPMQLYLYNSSRYKETESFTLTLGNAAITNPLGQDQYGYFIFDTGDVSYPQCPTYSWVGIAPAEGGSGTLLSITDTSTSGQEGDNNSADALATVTLPFTFKFYGVNYNQLTVCSNGFLTFGTSNNADFRNGRLPGPSGPNPMIAPFWDDLVFQTGSGIYVYNDIVNSRYIIEWYLGKNGDNTSFEETFQVILYNPSVYPTSTGDGPIKIQYKVFNNVDTGSAQSHGNYCTVGIKDHTGLVGLEYSFNNQYPIPAKPITNQSALYITTSPIPQDIPFITIGQTVLYDTNGNGYAEPGETIDIMLKLENIGGAAASNVTATISENDPWITISQATASYGTISGFSNGNNSTYFSLSVLNGCPNNYVATISVTITATGYTVNRAFTITVYKPSIILSSWAIDDMQANTNYIVDPGETGYLILNLNNASQVQADNVQINLSVNNTNLTLSPAQMNMTAINKETSLQIAPQYNANTLIAIGTVITITLNITSDNASAYNTTFNFTVGTGIRTYDFESDNGTFVATNSSTPGWEWGTSAYAGAHSGTKIWGSVLSGNYADNSTYELVSPSFLLASGASISFWHRYNFESTTTPYDGGRLMISTNNGSSWTTITPTGGYPNANVSVFNGPGYSGSLNPWTLATFSLTGYTNQTVKFKWQMKTDGSVTMQGWFIDDVTITNTTSSTPLGIISGTVTLIQPHDPVVNVIVSAGTTTVRPNDSGVYKLRLPAGNYNIKGNLSGYSEGNANATVILNTLVSNANLNLEYLTHPIGFTWMAQNNQLNLKWGADSRPTFLHYNIYRKIGTDVWSQVSESTLPSYSATLTQATWYDFKISAHYSNGESVPTYSIHIVYPNDGSQVAPMPPTNIYLNKTSNQFSLNWNVVNQDINGNSITPWGYQIYSSNLPYFVPSAQNYISFTDLNSWSVNLTPNSTAQFFKIKATIGYQN